jgi:hypothetical protein
VSALPPARRSRAGRSPLRRLLLAAVGLLLAAAVFVLGVGLGHTLRDDDRPAGLRTSARTLNPLPLAPVRETVTVTVTTGTP